MTRRSLLWPLVATASAAATVALAAGDVESPARTLVVAWFLLVCPGLALTWPLVERDLAVRLVLALPVSLAVNLVVTGALLTADVWSADDALAIVAGVTGAGALVTAGWSLRRSAP